MIPRVFITGYGIISSIGKNKSENLQSLTHGRHGFGELQILETIHQQDLPGCEIKLHDDELRALCGINPRMGYTRTALLGLIAIQEAIATAGLTKHEIQHTGLLSATTTGGIREFEKHFYALTDLEQSGDFAQFTDTANPGEHAERIAEHLGIEKYIATLSTACSSSANAIMQGAQLIRQKKIDRVICGGTEALSKFTVNGFNALMILDHAHCRPFDATRSGLNLGEGAAYLVLESEALVMKSQKNIFAELKGYGNANDAFHQTASSPEGTGALYAMQNALAIAQIYSTSIDYVNAHGTATENNDLSEGIGLQRLFGDKIPPFSSTKPFTGHTLAAAGGIEAVFSIMALQQQTIWPNLNFVHQMPELAIAPVTNLARSGNLTNIISNSFGFGGNTSSLIFSKV